MSEERERIRLRILALHKAINVQLAYGDAEEANRLRDQIGDLEHQIGQIDKRERVPRRERTTMTQHIMEKQGQDRKIQDTAKEITDTLEERHSIFSSNSATPHTPLQSFR